MLSAQRPLLTDDLEGPLCLPLDVTAAHRMTGMAEDAVEE